jgi:hypothetical protein
MVLKIWQPRCSDLVSDWIGGPPMNRMVLVLAMIATTIGTAAAARAQSPIASDQSAFGFELQQTTGPRGLAVEGYVHNALPWRITNVRLRVESVDANGALTAAASGWVLGDVPAGGRGYFYVPVSTPATTYRASVQAFDKVALEAQAP